ncbi:Plasmodium vivax Vir protein, putative [Plasmodium vivax]|nr:Plasmodium vivax Vir protein, putative [Plasmodium vivax]
MSEPYIDYCEGDDKNKIKDLLKNVTLYKLYDTFEHELKSNPEFGKCNEQCGAKLKGVSTEESKLLKLCKIICNVILNVIDSNGLYKGLSCSGSNIYMNIWLYEQVKKIKAKDYEINNFYDALVSIMKIRKSELENCSIINFHEKKNEYTNMKYLIEFLHIYEDIQKEITADLSAKDQLYCTYIRDFFKYYNSIEGSCRSTGTRPICCGSGNIRNVVSTLHTAILPSISISGILLIFYKFTPLGSYLRTRMRRKKNIKTNTHEEKYNNLENISTIQEDKADNLRYNIMYQ